MAENRESTREFPSILLKLALVSYALLGGGIIATKCFSQKVHTQVKWVEISDSLKEARKLGKPILYLFTAEWCAPCKEMKKEIFADNHFAATIEKSFVPVKVLDRQREDGANSKEIEDLQNENSIEAFPTLIVASSTRAETKRLEGYPGKADTIKFILDSSKWANKFDSESSYSIDWRPLKVLEKNGPSYKKPLLLFFLDESVTLSAYPSFPTKELARLLSEEYDSYLVSIDETEKAKDKLWSFKKELIKRYRIDQFPTLVVAPEENAIPHYLFNFYEPEETQMFLKNIADQMKTAK